MAKVDDIDLSEINISGSLTLTVAQRSGKRVRLARIDTNNDVTTAFREVISDTIDEIESRDAETWTPDAEVTPETYLVAPISTLGDAPQLTTEFDGQTLTQVLRHAQTVDKMDAKHIPASDLVFYVLTIDTTDGERVSFLRRSNPRRGLRRPHMFAALSDSLSKIDEPIFAFDEFIDVIFVEDQVVVLNQTAFALLFRDQQALMAQVPTWVTQLNEHVPVTKKGQEVLAAKALSDTRLRTRLEAIVTRGHLPNVSKKRLRQAMQETDLDVDQFINKKGKLQFQEEDVPQILYFLNEDLYFGALTDTGFRADRKAAR